MAQQFISSQASREDGQARIVPLADISHDLRTPLNVIIGFAGLMLDEVPGQINEEQRQCLNDILNSARRLQSLIDDIPDPSRHHAPKAGRIDARHHGE